MLRPSRDWRESITLSSRDPHFGQRIVSEDSVSHNNLWRQRAKTTIAQFRFRGRRTSPHSARTRPANRRVLRKTGRRPVLPCSVASISNKDATQILCPRHEVFLSCGRFGSSNFFLWLCLFLFELETNFPVFQFQVCGKGPSLFRNEFVEKIGFSGRN